MKEVDNAQERLRHKSLDYLNSFRRFEFNTYVHIHYHCAIDQSYQHCNDLPTRVQTQLGYIQ
jgi:hypothetical protein